MFFKNCNTEMIILLSSAVKEVYSNNEFWTTKQMFDPLHVAATYGQKYLYKYIEEKVGDKNPRCRESGIDGIDSSHAKLCIKAVNPK